MKYENIKMAFTILMQIAFIVFMFFIQKETIEALNSGGLHTLISLLFIAPLFVVPLFSNIITSVTYSIILLIKRNWWPFAIQLVILAFSLYFAINFFGTVHIS